MTERPTDTNRWPALIIICLGYVMILDVTHCRRRPPVDPGGSRILGELTRQGRDAYPLTFGGFLLLAGACIHLAPNPAGSSLIDV